MAGPTYGSWHTSATPDDEVRTIFITGFPSDTKERELQNLLRWWPGYEACQLTMKGEAPLGFALFNSQAMALAARDALQNLVFDLETNSTLRAEMAKKNLFVKKGVVPSAQQAVAMSPMHSYDSNKRSRVADVPGPSYLHTMGGYGSSGFPGVEAPPGAVYPTYSYALPLSPAPMSAPLSQPIASPVQFPHHHQYLTASPASSTPRRWGGGGGGAADKDNPPCNTLFVGNLGEGVSEHEMEGIFGVLPGYRQMKLLKQPHATVCFIEYADIETATAAHSCTQGTMLTSSDRGGLRVQFSKNPFGKKRDGSFHPNSALGAPVAPVKDEADANGATSP